MAKRICSNARVESAIATNRSAIIVLAVLASTMHSRPCLAAYNGHFALSRLCFLHPKYRISDDRTALPPPPPPPPPPPLLRHRLLPRVSSEEVTAHTSTPTAAATQQRRHSRIPLCRFAATFVAIDCDAVLLFCLLGSALSLPPLLVLPPPPPPNNVGTRVSPFVGSQQLL